MQIILGTAAIGSNYGIKNKGLSFSDFYAREILNSAREMNITALDTSPQYGLAQEYVGNYHKDNYQFQVFSKLPIGLEDKPDLALECVAKSLKEMRISKLSGLYFHSAKNLLSVRHDDAINTMKNLAISGLVESIGVSIYDSDELDQIISRFSKIDIVQVPENIMDQRLMMSTTIRKARVAGKRFFVRSVFLQGMLLMKPTECFSQGQDVNRGLRELEEFSTSLGVEPIDVCLSYLKHLGWADGAVIGISRPEQLKRIINFKEIDLSNLRLPTPFTHEISDPRNWCD
jgi:aryl-alcohol dehydrogenase-like predicted oxidoreductase